MDLVKRRDITRGATGAAAGFGALILAAVALTAGAWWWMTGRTRPGAAGVLLVLARAVLFTTALALAYAGGAVAWAATAAVFGMAAAGWWLAPAGER